ncbi:MAG: hypothetical protein ABEJ98_00055 [Candidatus Nanohaloarchaea archaeon]
MEQSRAALSLLALIVLASGCAHTTGTDSSPGDAVKVTKLEVVPDEIRAGSKVRVDMGVTNTGVLPADLILDRTGELDGDAILTDYCPDLFDVTGFEAYSSSEPSTQDSYSLKQGEQVMLSWELTQTGDIGVNGARCPMNFKVPFNYTVEAYRQVKVLRNDEVGASKPAHRSSEGPLKILIETIGSSSEKGVPYFIKGDSIGVLVQLINENPSEAKYRGAVKVQQPVIEMANTGGNFRLGGCDTPEGETLTLYEGESIVIRCGLNYTLDAPSITGEIRARTNYTYIKNAGTREVKIKYAGR